MSIIVIGGGPAGMMSAIAAAQKGKRVILIEKNERLGRKIYISGKGRCNLTNDTDIQGFLKSVVSNPKFLQSAAYTFPPSETKRFFEGRGVALKTERGARVFPASDKAAEVIDCLLGALKAYGVEVKTSETVLQIANNNGKIDRVITNKGEYVADSVIIATGGLSYPKTGSSGDGYTFAEGLGHTIVTPAASLVPILLHGAYNAEDTLIDNDTLPFPQGLSIKNAEAKITSKGGKTIYGEFGEMLFTDEGVSGPTVLTLSSKINRARYDELMFAIDFKPALDEKTLDARILRDFGAAPNKQFCNSLGELLPKSLIPYIVELSCINPQKPVNSISRIERKNLLNLLKNMSFPIQGLASIDQAIVTAGGVSVKEINPANMRSKIIDNLYFAGEVLDVDAVTGGYNIQIAFSTGYLAGSNA